MFRSISRLVKAILFPFVTFLFTSLSWAGFYAGGGINDSEALVDAYSGDQGTFDSGVSANGFAGYKMNAYSALEIGGRYWDLNLDNDSGKDQTLLSNAELGFRFYLPIAENTQLTARLGAHRWFINDDSDDDYSDLDLSSGQGFYYGFGVSQRFMKRLEISLLYEMHSAHTANIESIGLQAAYYFGDLFEVQSHSHLERLYFQAFVTQFDRGEFEDDVFVSDLNFYNDLNTYVFLTTGSGADFNTSIEEKKIGPVLYAGYQLNDWLAFELGYADFGEVEYHVGTVQNQRGLDVVIDETLYSSKSSAYLFGMNSSLYQTENGLSVYNRMGISAWTTELERYFIVENNRVKGDFEGVSPYVGLGVAWHFTDSLGVLIEYTIFRQTSSGDGGLIKGASASTESIGIGLQYSLGSGVKRINRPSKGRSIADSWTSKSNLKSTTACDEKYRDMFFGCDSTEGSEGTEE
ncbi:MAG: outer membrane beta-barrel protein [Pseudomonadales bacterium]|nr:outer membrane beta-barrel protein [Pseudomonadales bacterium]